MDLVDSAPEAAQKPAIEFTTGQVLDGRYRLASRIGRGGFGDVWRAEELLPDGAPFREVALKLLLATVGDEGGWAEEAKLLASFRHPSLVTIYAAGILDLTPPTRFVAMELLEGQNLSDLLRARGQVPWRRVLRWACSAAAALDVIHIRGVVHLDLKPANLFLASDGALKVLDFGIARRAGSRQSSARRHGAPGGAERLRTREAELGTAHFLAEQGALAATQDVYGATRPMPPPDDPRPAATVIQADRERRTMTLARPRSEGREVLIGTPGFMAPEVLELCEPTAAADAYALAVCVVQLITGRLPYAAEDEPAAWDDPTAVSAWLDDLRRATLRGDLRAFSSDPARLPRGLGTLLHRLLAVDPQSRGVSPGKLGELFEEAWQRPAGVPDPPYLGLAPYPAQAEGVLFGRDDDIGRLGRELEYEPAVVLQGVHGSGKSSLASAGLVPYLGLRGVDGKDDWIAARVAPGAYPDEALARALEALAPELRGASPEALAAHAQASPVGVVLIVDPLDEALATEAPRRARLDALMTAIAEGTARTAPPQGTPSAAEPRPITGRITPGLRLIAVLGEERAAALLEGKGPEGALRAAIRFVGAPSIAAVADIVAGPAHFAAVLVYGIDVIAADVQRELRTGAYRLPYVALALRAFWDASMSAAAAERRSVYPDAPAGGSSAPRALNGDRWRELGGVRGALCRHADRVLASLDRAERPVASELLLRLSATDGAPLRWREEELVDTLGTEAERARAGRVLDVLVREHIVRRVGGSVEIGHEAWLTGWAHLTGIRLHQMDRLVFLERVREAAQAWERADNHRDLLLHGALLEEMIARREWAFRGLTPRERAFVGASRRRARVRRATNLALGVVVLVALVGGIMGKRSMDAARDADMRATLVGAEREQTAEIAAKARRTEDPYRRAAYIAAAMARGSTDGMLPLELARTASGLPRAEFLTLEPISGATFPWGGRFVLGQSGSATLTLVDLSPAEPDVIEDIDFDTAPEAVASAHFHEPKITEIRPHGGAIVEWARFAFDSSIATRAADGEVKVIRLRRDGSAAVAATAPFRCTGAIHLAEAAPVLACATAEGIVRWDLREARPGAAASVAVATRAFAGNVASVSSDGARIAAIDLSRVLVWAPGEGRESVYLADAPAAMALFSPSGEALAVIHDSGFEIVDLRPGDPAAPLTSLVRGALSGLPTSARWDDRELDLGVCEAAGAGRWFYLRPGGRAKDDAPPVGSPCAPRRGAAAPALLGAPTELEEIAGRDLGPHQSVSGWKLKGGHFLSRDLVLFDVAESAASRLLRFQGRDEGGGDELRLPDDAVVAVERSADFTLFQVGDEIRVYASSDGTRIGARPGHLLRRCADGSVAAWIAGVSAYHVFDAVRGTPIGAAPRSPGFVVGADSACRVIYLQGLDGAILERSIVDLRPPRTLALADGYVYSARPSLARGGRAAGLWLALSSGAIARIDEATGAARLYGYATPRAAALGDGPQPGQAALIDSTGVMILGEDGTATRAIEASREPPWEDLSVAPDGASMLLVSAERVATLDLLRHEITGSIPSGGASRLSPWDADGSVIAWSFERTGGPEGVLIPRGVRLAGAVAASLTNLAVDKGKLVIKR
jgi:serine/threonine protein kinase